MLRQRPGTFLATDQLNAQMIVFYKFIIFPYMFRALLCSSSAGQIALYSIWYRHTLLSTCAPEGHLQSVTIPDAV